MGSNLGTCCFLFPPNYWWLTH